MRALQGRRDFLSVHDDDPVRLPLVLGVLIVINDRLAGNPEVYHGETLSAYLHAIRA